MVGSIVSVSLLSICFHAAYMPYSARVIAQITAGAFIGCTVDKQDLVSMKRIYKPGAVMLASMLTLNLVIGTIIYWISPMDLMTSMLCAVPGGLSTIPLIAIEFGADTTKVVVLQFLRMCAGVGIFPSLILWIGRKQRNKQNEQAKKASASNEESIDEKGKAADDTKITKQQRRKAFFIVAVVAGCAGVLGKILPIPSGALLFSMLSVLGIKFLGIPAYMPRQVKRAAQVLSGAYIGSSIGYTDIVELPLLIWPIAVVLTAYLLNSLLTGWFLSYKFGIRIEEAMLTVTPAGASDMALLSSDLGIQSQDLIVLQIVRMLFAVSVFPQIIRVIVILIG